MRCYCLENEETFDFFIEDASVEAVVNIEAAWFKREGHRFVKRYPAWIEDHDILSRNFSLLGPSMFKRTGTWEASLWIFAQICESEQISWAITGSVSEAVQGVALTPHDIDIVCHTEDFSKMKKIFLDHMVEPFIDHGGAGAVRYFGRICLRGIMIDIVADESRNSENYTFQDVIWREIPIKVESIMDRLIIELHRKREERIQAFNHYFSVHVSHEIERGLLSTYHYLNSEAALNSIDRDPYWPKWDSTWWHMSALFEMGLTVLIPEMVIDRMIVRMDERYLKIFPIHEHELPEGIDVYTRIPCHCQLGNMYQILRSHRQEIDQLLPWIRPWFLRYQLPDGGGLNCEDDAYRNSMKSSIASSLPVFEAMMMIAEESEITAQEMAFLNRGVAYLTAHRLVYKISGDLMDADFIKLQFPRFYSYDILRGMHFLMRWKQKFGESNALLLQAVNDVLAESISHVKMLIRDGKLSVMRSELFDRRTRDSDGAGAFTIVKPVTLFPLLEAIGKVGASSAYLTWQFNDVLERIDL